MVQATEFVYNYATLARLTGTTVNSMQQHKTRGSFDPADLESVVLFLARFGKDSLRQAIILAATTNATVTATREREQKKRATKKPASRK